MATAVDLTPGGLFGVPQAGLRALRDVLTAGQKSAEGIVSVQLNGEGLNV